MQTLTTSIFGFKQDIYKKVLMEICPISATSEEISKKSKANKFF